MSKAVTLEVKVDSPFLVKEALESLKSRVHPRRDWHYKQYGPKFVIKRDYHDLVINGETGVVTGEDLFAQNDMDLFLQYYSLAKIKQEVLQEGHTILSTSLSSDGHVTLLVESYAA